MKNRFKLLTFISLFTIILFNIIVLRSLRISNDNLKERIGNSSHQIQTLKEMLRNHFAFEKAQLINENIFTENDEHFSLKTVSLEYPILVFRFSKVNCIDCIVENIYLIKSFLNDESIRYIFISDYSNKRDLSNFKRLNSIHEEVYNCRELIEGEPNLSYFAVLEQDGRLGNIYFPDDDFPDLTRQYLHEVKQRYFY